MKITNPFKKKTEIPKTLLKEGRANRLKTLSEINERLDFLIDLREKTRKSTQTPKIREFLEILDHVIGEYNWLLGHEDLNEEPEENEESEEEGE